MVNFKYRLIIIKTKYIDEIQRSNAIF